MRKRGPGSPRKRAKSSRTGAGIVHRRPIGQVWGRGIKRLFDRLFFLFVTQTVNSMVVPRGEGSGGQ